MIKVEGLSFSYGKRKIFDNVSFETGAGKCLVLAGPNGCGKSTVLSIIAGALKPSGGKAMTSGKVGYVPQGTALLEDATVKENLKFFSGLARVAVPKALPFSVEKYLNRKVSSLSGGMKKQVSIACALIGHPQLILLDEPCAALDIAFRDEMIDIIGEWKSQGKTVVYVGHDPMEFYSIYDELVFLDRPVKVFARKDVEASSVQTEAEFIEFYKNALSSIERK